MPLNPQTAGFLQQLAAAGAKPFYEIPPAQCRVVFDGLLASLPPSTAKIASAVDRTVPGPGGALPIRIFTPLGKGPFPILVYFHGGGFTIGSLDSHDPLCRELASLANTIVISVAYRMGPEEKFPAAMDDAYAATKWASEHATELGGDAQRVSVGGDSAGGNLAAVTAIRARDEGGPALAAQLLIYPVTNAGGPPTKSMIANAEGPLLTKKDMDWFIGNYLASDADAKNPLCSPALAKSHAGLPAALVLTCEMDPLCDEGEAYAALLQKAGVPVVSSRYDGAIHGTLSFFTVLDQGRAMMDESARWLRERNRV